MEIASAGVASLNVRPNSTHTKEQFCSIAFSTCLNLSENPRETCVALELFVILEGGKAFFKLEPSELALGAIKPYETHNKPFDLMRQDLFSAGPI